MEIPAVLFDSFYWCQCCQQTGFIEIFEIREEPTYVKDMQCRTKYCFQYLSKRSRRVCRKSMTYAIGSLLIFHERKYLRCQKMIV